MNISYKPVSEFPGWDRAGEFLRDLIVAHQARKILEVGSGANPTLTAAAVSALGVSYTTNDISAQELEKAPAGFERLQMDLCVPDAAGRSAQRFDLIFSRMVNEHVSDGRRYFSNLYELLRPGGATVHCYSTLYALPFLANRLMPESLSSPLLNLFCARDRHQHEKFKAYYSWSRGPTARQIQRFQSLGFEVVEYCGYFGHGYYKQQLPLLHGLELAKSGWLMRHPCPYFTSYAHVVLRKSLT